MRRAVCLGACVLVACGRVDFTARGDAAATDAAAIDGTPDALGMFDAAYD